MFNKVRELIDKIPSLCSFYTDIIEEPLIAGRFLVYSDPTVLLILDGKEAYRSSGFINIEELNNKITQFIEIYGAIE